MNPIFTFYEVHIELREAISMDWISVASGKWQDSELETRRLLDEQLLLSASSQTIIQMKLHFLECIMQNKIK